MATNSFLKPNPANRKSERNADPNMNEIWHLIENFNIGKFYELSVNEGEVENLHVTDNISYMLYIAESRWQECPKLQIKIAGEEIETLIDTGCEMSILNEYLYNKLKHAGLKCLELPTQHVNLVSAFNDKSKRVKKQALLEVTIETTKLDQVVLLSAQLLTEVILGIDFLINYEAEISFPERRIMLTVNEGVFNFQFTSAGETSASRSCDLGLMTIHPQIQHLSTAVSGGHCDAENFSTKGVDTSIQGWRKESGMDMEVSKYLLSDKEICKRLLNDENEASEQEEKGKCSEKAIAARHERGSRVCRQSLATFAEVVESSNPDSLYANKQELIKGNSEGNEKATDCTSLGLTTTYSKADDVSTPQKSGANKISPDDRTISERQPRATVCEENRLTVEQQEELYKVLARYRQQLTKRPGKCTRFEYEFRIEGSMPKSANSRPIPFALRYPVRDQIQEMLRDGILEESHSAYINHITPVVREGKAVRICLDARRINKQMDADCTKVMPMPKLLQKFHGAKYITSLDLSSSFLQIPLE